MINPADPPADPQAAAPLPDKSNCPGCDDAELDMLAQVEELLIAEELHQDVVFVLDHVWPCVAFSWLFQTEWQFFL